MLNSTSVQYTNYGGTLSTLPVIQEYHTSEYPQSESLITLAQISGCRAPQYLRVSDNVVSRKRNTPYAVRSTLRPKHSLVL